MALAMLASLASAPAIARQTTPVVSIDSAIDGPAGMLRLDMMLGGSFYDDGYSTRSQFRAGAYFGVNLIPRAWSPLYIGLPLAFGFGNGFATVRIIPEVEWDLRISKAIPLYFFPAVGIGALSAYRSPCNDEPSACMGESFVDAMRFAVHAGGGFKYIHAGRLNVSVQPLSVDAVQSGSSKGWVNFWNLMVVGVGANFGR